MELGQWSRRNDRQPFMSPSQSGDNHQPMVGKSQSPAFNWMSGDGNIRRYSTSRRMLSQGTEYLTQG